MLGGHCHLRGQGSVHGPSPPACLGAGVFAEVQVTCPHQRGRPWGPGVSERDLAATWKQSPGPRLEDTSGLLPVTGPRPRPSPRSLGKGTAWRRASERDGYGVARAGTSRLCDGPKADVGSLCRRRGGARRPPSAAPRCGARHSVAVPISAETDMSCQRPAPGICGPSPAAKLGDGHSTPRTKPHV